MADEQKPYVPRSLAEWRRAAEEIVGAPPDFYFDLSETSYSLVDSMQGEAIDVGEVKYQNAVTGWSSKKVEPK